MNKFPFRIQKVRLEKQERFVDTKEGTFLLKPHQDMNATFSFLERHHIPYFIKPIQYDDRYDVYPCEIQESFDCHLKRRNLGKVLASIHKNTCFYKEKDSYRIEMFYQTNLKKIEELTAYYNSMSDEFESYWFPTPAMRYYLRYSSIIFFHLKLVRALLEDWYQLAQEITSERMVFCNLACTLNQYYQGKYEALLDWSKAKFASPLEDVFILLSEKDDYGSVLITYEEIFELTPFERLELWIIELLPKEIRFHKSFSLDYANFLKVKEMYDRLNSFYQVYLKYQQK